MPPRTSASSERTCCRPRPAGAPASTERGRCPGGRTREEPPFGSAWRPPALQPDQTSTGPGRPATTSPSSSPGTAGQRRRAPCPRRPAQLPAGRARCRLPCLRRRTAHRRPGTPQPL